MGEFSEQNETEKKNFLDKIRDGHRYRRLMCIFNYVIFCCVFPNRTCSTSSWCLLFIWYGNLKFTINQSIIYINDINDET